MSYLNGIATYVNTDLQLAGNTLLGEAACGDIHIKGRYIILKSDHESFKQNVLNTIFLPGQARCICDYIIISDEIVLVCELKSNNEGEMKTQLKNTGKFVRYLLEMIKDRQEVAIQMPPIKYVCFGNLHIEGKQNSKAKKLGRIEWNNSELFRLSCNSIYHLKQFN